MEKEFFLIAGFGNPGREYRNTRHNVGFRLMDGVVSEFKFQLTKVQFKAMTGTIELDNARIILANRKPL